MGAEENRGQERIE